MERERQMKVLTAMVESGEEKHCATLQSLKEAMEKQQHEYSQSLNALEEKVSHCVDIQVAKCALIPFLSSVTKGTCMAYFMVIMSCSCIGVGVICPGLHYIFHNVKKFNVGAYTLS